MRRPKSRVINLDKGDVLMSEGDTSENIFYVLSGSFNVSMRKEGKVVILGKVNKDEFVGEMAFVNKAPRLATVVAAEASKALVITPEEFQYSLEELEPWLQKFIATLIRRLKEAI